MYEKTPLLEEQDKALTLIHKDEPQTRIKVRVKDGFAVAEVKLQKGKEDADNEAWTKLLFPDTVKEQKDLKHAELYLKVVATENTFTVRSSEEFLKDKPFVLSTYTCGCQRCVTYQDVVPNPEINNQTYKNKNRFKKALRYNNTHPEGYYHEGTDILADVSTPLYSLMCGKVIHVRSDLPFNDPLKSRESATSFGNTVVIESATAVGEKVYLLYAHMSTVSVKVDERVIHGQFIGTSGRTGNAWNIDEEDYHVHIEAGNGYSTYASEKKCKIISKRDPEEFMKTKFDKDGNAIK